MKKEEILNQEECDQDLNMILSTFNSVYNEKSKQISYSDTYNMVYKLCKKGQAEQIMKELKTTSIQNFQRMLSSIDKQKYTIEDYLQMFSKVQECIQRLSQILLYVESNYMNDQKKQTTIKQLLNQIFFEVLCVNKDILEKISEIIAEQRCSETQTQLDSLIGAINYLDQKQVYLPQFLFQVYNKRVSEYYRKLFATKYSELQITQFLQFALQKLKKDKQWLQKYFMRVKGKKTLEQLTRKIFENSLAELIKKINDQKSKQLFQFATYDFLALLNQKNQVKLINDFNDWYIQQIRKRLDKIDRLDNSYFLHQFVKEYQTITERLSSIKDFNIGYKATFFFENWVNQDKVHFPQRLNVLIQKLILKDKFTPEQQKLISILFKLLKEKDFFEKQFRSASALRSIYSDKKNSPSEELIVFQMAKHCGADWVQKLRSLRNSLSESILQVIPNFSAIVFQDTVWPFQKIKSKYQIPIQLLNLSANYKAQYEEKYKGRVIQWHPIQGYTILSIKFKDHVQQFKMDTAMTTILLNLQSHNFKTSVSKIVELSGLSFKQLSSQLQVLKQKKILLIDNSTLNSEQASKITLTLNLEFPASSCLIDLTQQYLEQQFVENQGHEQLKSERKMMVESFIVKIMKSNKIITKKELFQIITPMIEGRGFMFNQKFVDNCFEVLLDKRYIKDLEDGTYSYLAS